jgi:ribonuclease R
MTQIPSKDEILAWISDNPTLTSKRDIAKAFGIRGGDRIELKRLLRELEDEGHLTKRKKTYRDPDKLPPVAVLEVAEITPDGDIYAKALEWQGEGEPPRILFTAKPGDPALAEGDRILCRMTEAQGENHAYEARLIRRIGQSVHRILGVFRKGAEGGRVVPIDKGVDKEWMVPAGATNEAKDGELVEAEQTGPKTRMGLPRRRGSSPGSVTRPRPAPSR